MNLDWSALFGFGVSPLELVVRGTSIYWSLFLLFRFVLRRDIGSIAIADVLLVVLIADASQNAMSGGYDSISEGLVLIGTIGAWNYLLDWLSFHNPWLRKLMEPSPLKLVIDGRLQRKNMRTELITLEELEGKLRESGVDRLDQVASATLETDGTITVIKRKDDDTQRPRQAHRPSVGA